MIDFQHHDEDEGAGDAELDSVQIEHLKLLEKIGIGFDDDDDELDDGDVRRTTVRALLYVKMVG